MELINYLLITTNKQEIIKLIFLKNNTFTIEHCLFFRWHTADCLMLSIDTPMISGTSCSTRILAQQHLFECLPKHLIEDGIEDWIDH